MKKIINEDELNELLKKLHGQHKRITVAGGCFDMLHPGHLAFLNAAKERGDILLLLLESDEAIKKMKGPHRPAHTQTERGKNLAALPFVDYIFPLQGMLTDKSYDELILAIKPAIIATTKGDLNRHHKERQAKLSGAQILDVLDRLPEYSTTKLLSQ